MEPFRLKKYSNQQSNQPLVRVSAPYYRLLCRLKAETGLSMGNILAQCMDYALGNGGAWENEILDQFTKCPESFRCPLMAEEGQDDADT